MTKFKFDIQLNWRNKKSIPAYLMIVYFVFALVVFFRKSFLQELQQPVTYLLLIWWVAIVLLSVVEINKVRVFFQKRSKWINGFVLTLSPILSFLMVEIMVSNYNMKMFKAYSLYNLIWYIIIYFLLFALLRSSRLTVIIGTILIYMASVLNYLVYLFRGNPILPSDLLAWQTGVSVASNYHLSFTRGFIISTLVMFMVIMLGLKLEKSDKKPGLANRLAVIGTYALFTGIVFNIFFNTDLIKNKIRVLDFFAPKYTYCSYGTAFGFVANAQAMETKKPEGYSVDIVKATLEAAGKDSTNAAASQDKPNIIVIMNEAFSDLSMIGDYRTNMDYLPFIRSLNKNTVKGDLYVSVFGGATSDTEYEFLTGNSMAVMPQNCVPYQQFVTDPTDSLAQTLKDQGYYDIAIHPYEPSGYKRDLVYPLLGFDEFISMKDFKNPTLIRSFISDRDSYSKIIEEYERKGKNQPLFIFNVTMQNHGGYSESRVFDDENTVRLLDYNGYGSVEQYLSLLRESDKAFQTLIDYFQSQKEHTIILLYGDHQPVVYSYFHDELSKQGEITDTDALQRKYKVPFILWANYDIPKENIEKISANYLSSYLLKTAGLKRTAYNDYLLKLHEQVPVINGLFYIDKEDVLHRFSDATAYEDLIRNYRYTGYNDALDKKGKLREYYYLK